MRRTMWRGVFGAMLLAGLPVLAELDGDWPAISRTNRPWAFTWWLGSAVDKENLAAELRRCADAGLGGVHIIPIYGAKGAEARYIDYMSPRWLEMLDFTVAEADRLGLGVDMTLGSGWCFGGPMITRELGGQSLVLSHDTVAAGGRIDGKVPQGARVVARASDGSMLDLTGRVDAAGRVDWTAEAGPWQVGVLSTKASGMKVKRAAPGATGLMLNPFDGEAMRTYLAWFDQRFAGYAGRWPRAVYHDSYEYYGAQWAAELPEAFAARRGYRLEEQLPAFCGAGDADTVARVRADYRETVSDLMCEATFPQWTAWARGRGMVTRNQAHGSPGNLLDLYALADIPETEMFGRGKRDPLRSGFDERLAEGDREPLVSKLASSAAHVSGRRLASSETGTWMAEHFCETLEEMKGFVDRMFVSGINHVFYHGCVYSPDDVPWPGWLFYAATEMNPRNAIWRDAPALNDYIARCQSVLQQGEPDNDVLLYWPIHDRWHVAKGLPDTLTVHDRDWMTNQPLGQVAGQLWRRGYGFDYVSDRLLRGARVEAGALCLAQARYRVVVVPPAERMPLETVEWLLALAREGATVIFVDHLPGDVPGLGALETRRGVLRRLVEPLAFESAGDNVFRAGLGRGQVLRGALEPTLDIAAVPRERLCDHGEQTLMIRRRVADGRYLFIANQTVDPLRGWHALAWPAASARLFDPLDGRSGAAMLRRDAATGETQVYLDIEPGHSMIVRTYDDRAPSAEQPVLAAVRPGADLKTLDGPWEIRFVQGGPALPTNGVLPELASWTTMSDPEALRFAGSACYRKTFDLAGDVPKSVVLDLGKVCHSARVRLNGRDLGTLIMNPYRLALPADLLRTAGNVLEVEVTNLSANRLRDLDRRKVPWRIFHDINFVSITYQPFDASAWPLFESGLLGPVRLSRSTGIGES